MALPPGHGLFQFYVSDGELSCQLYPRSADIFLGEPFTLASYALLTLRVVQVCGLKPGEFIHTFGDLHLDANHVKQVKLPLTRAPRPVPTRRLTPAVTNLHDFKYEDFKLVGYAPHPAIKAPGPAGSRAVAAGTLQGAAIFAARHRPPLPTVGRCRLLLRSTMKGAGVLPGHAKEVAPVGARRFNGGDVGQTSHPLPGRA